MKTEFALMALYDRVLIPLEEFATKELGIKLQTAKNQIARGTFPIKITKIGKAPMIHVADAGAYIDSLRDAG